MNYAADMSVKGGTSGIPVQHIGLQTVAVVHVSSSYVPQLPKGHLQISIYMKNQLEELTH